jgi:adenosylcobinamide kinase/adenosylcobinamide-phosphate guanylyltransferase
MESDMIELIVGGARSGKSRHALDLAKSTGNKLHFVATGKALDDAMTDRILRHQAERGSEWSLVEEPENLSLLVSGFSESDTVVVDCLTLWVTNWLCGENPRGWQGEKEAFITALEKSPAHWILVSNETGMGVIPMGELSREFVDESGWLHQQIAKVSNSVTLVMFGIPQILKPVSKP